MKLQLPTLLLISFLIGNPATVEAQHQTDQSRTGRLEARKVENGIDNYARAAFNFEFGGNGPEIQKVCRNDWDLLFGNSPLPNAFDVSLVTDDRS